jgi:basic membrane protein A
MPVAGPVGLGTAAAVKERGNAWIIGVDSDWALINPDYAPVTLTSVMKLMDATTYDAIKQVVDGTFKGGATVGNLQNNGVAIAPFHDADSVVPAELKTELEQVRADMLAGKIKLSDSYKLK